MKNTWTGQLNNLTFFCNSIIYFCWSGYIILSKHLYDRSLDSQTHVLKFNMIKFTFILVRNLSIRLIATKRTSDGRSYQTLRHRRTWAEPSRIPVVISLALLLVSGSSKWGWNLASNASASCSIPIRDTSSPGLPRSIPGVNSPCNGTTTRMAQRQACTWKNYLVFILCSLNALNWAFFDLEKMHGSSLE